MESSKEVAEVIEHATADLRAEVENWQKRAVEQANRADRAEKQLLIDQQQLATERERVKELEAALKLLAKGTACHGSSRDYGRGFQYYSEWSRGVAGKALAAIAQQKEASHE
jgi:MoxR-like ATPase